MHRISKYSYQLINNLCNKKETLVSKSSLLNMRNITKKNQIIFASQYVHNELPIRLARRVKDLENLPLQLESHHEIFKVRDWYLQSLDDITILKKPTNEDDCNKMYEIVKKIHNRHSNTMNTMAQGIDKLKEKKLINKDIDNFLTNFYYNRTKTRFLIRNYLDYFNDDLNKLGALKLNCKINDIIKNVISDIESLCDIHHIINIPNINVNVNDKEFIYVEPYLHYILIEILKNSLVAVKNKKNPLIEINGFTDNNYIILKITDNGSGISDFHMNDIWKFSFTTSPIDYKNDFQNDFEKKNPISGFGYGLPISRIILQTFNGNIRIFSKKNIGTDTYLFIDISSDWKF